MPKFRCVIAAAILLEAPAAQAAPSTGLLFNDFLRYCAAHEGDAQAPLNEVLHDGWKAIPQAQLQKTLPLTAIPGLKPEWYGLYIGIQPTRNFALWAGRGQLFSGTNFAPISITFCVLMTKPDDPISLERAISWSRAIKLDGQLAPVYLFSEAPTGRQPTSLAEIYHEFQKGSGRELFTLSGSSTQPLSALALIAPVKAH